MSDALLQLVRGLTPEVRTALAELLRHHGEPVAVVGIGCRMPGGGDGPEGFWRALRDGREGIREVPSDRWNVDDYYSRTAGTPGKMNTRWGGFIDEVDRFDADFFGISPREAARMDPQQRLLLEVTAEALEDAGQPPSRLSGQPVGVFVGVCAGDYAYSQFKDVTQMDAYTATGNAHSIVANRVSYQFDLRGPSVAIDTACSSSLVAVHLALQSLRSNESAVAIAGGVQLILAPHAGIAFSRAQLLAPDGRCKTFDARADGFARGEGCGVVILKRLSDAIRAKDTIRAVIHGSAVNQDGRSNGLMAPNGMSQQVVVRQALREAGVDPDQITFIEAHGTGTSLGDPIEVEALSEVFGNARGRSKCALGSVKTNIGHLEGASGIAGLIKTILAVEHEYIPAHLHFRKLNPNISFENTPFYVPTTGRAWSGPRYAGVSSFGFGGTNAHVVVGEVPPAGRVAPAKAPPPKSAYLFVLSAKAPAALIALAKRHVAWLGEGSLSIQDVVYTAGSRRSQYEHRLAVVGESTRDLQERIAAHLEGKTGPHVAVGSREPVLQVGMVFTGQGSQWAGMGSELLRSEPVFAGTIDEVGAAFAAAGAAFDIRQELEREASAARLDDTEIAQPAIFAVQMALVALLRCWGIRPAAVVGHSLGEVAAACTAGGLGVSDAARVVLERSRRMGQARSLGKMLGVELPLDEAIVLAGEHGLEIAADNGPRAVVLTGAGAAIESLRELLGARGVATRIVSADYPFHSRYMDGVLEDFTRSLRTLAPTACATPMYSTITGARVAAALDAAYWAQNVRSQVKFHGATSAMLRDGINVLFEIGPHPDLRRHLLDTVSRCAPSPLVASSLRRNAGERDSLLRGVGALYTAGQDVDFDAINGEGRLVAAPRYPWQRQRHWMDPASVAISVDVSPRPEEKSRPAHPLLGVRLVGERAATFESVLGDGQPALLEDHRLHGAVVVPAVAYIEAILAASSELGGGGECELRDVAIQEALVVPDRERRVMRTVLEEAGDGFSFRISSLDSDRVSERTHVSGTLVIRGLNGAAGSATDLDLAALTGRCASEVPVDAYYQELRRRGFDYGPAFRGIRRCWVGAEDAFGLVDLGEGSSQDRDGYRLHPTLLEGCLQVVGVLAPSRIDMNDTYVPIGIERVRFFGGAGDSLWSHARLRPDHPDNRETLVADVRIFSAMGVLVAEVRGLAAKRAGARSFIKAADARIHGWLHAVEWRLAEARPPTGERAPWLVLADVGSWAPLLREHVESQGRRCVLVSRSEAASFEDGERVESEREEAFVAALSSELAKEEGRVDVICLWPLDQSPLRGEPVDLGAVLGRSVTSLLALARALERVGKANAKLWVVTTNAHRVRERDVPDPAQAALWGLAATLGLEYASHWGGIVDVAGEASPASARALAEAIDRGREDRAAVRAESVWVPRLRRLRGTDSAEPLPVVEDATYLVTGGLGGIGLEAARWLCNRGARQLVLLGRREPSEDARAAVDEMERKGTRVATLPIDVSDAAALSEVLERVKREGPPLRGVFHAAGVLDDGTLARQTWRRFAGVLAGKAQGAWNLDVLTRGEELDFFVCFSSLASAFGSPGQGSYATANAFLDGLAQLRASEGRPAMTANWGPWSEVGMAARLGADAHWRRVPGLSPLATHDGLKALERALAQRVPQVLVLPVNWTDFARALSDPPPWMADVTPSIPDGPASPRFSVDAAFLDGLRASPAHERPDAISRFLRRQIAEVVGAKPEDIDPDRGLFDLGFDSLMAMELKNRLQGMLGRTLPATALFEHPDLSALSRYLADELGRAVDAPPRSPTPASAPSRLSISSDILARVEEMSDEEVERTLAEMAPEGEA